MCLLKNIAADTSQRAFPSFYEVVFYKSQGLYRKNRVKTDKNIFENSI